MVESKSALRIALFIVGAMLGIVVGTEACQGPTLCPPRPGGEAIQWGCMPSQPPAVKTTGACRVCPSAVPNMPIPGCAVLGNANFTVIDPEGARLCHVDMTFGTTGTWSADLVFVAESDYNGCRGGFYATYGDGGPINTPLSVPDDICRAGLGIDASDVE